MSEPTVVITNFKRPQWVTLLHDDDLLLPDYTNLKKHLERDTSAGFWLWDARRHGMGFNDAYPTLDLPTGLYQSEMLFRNLLIPDHFTLSPTIGCFQREDLISTLEECEREFKGPEFHIRPTMMVGNDLMLWLRAIQKHACLGYIKGQLTSYGHHEGSATCDEVFKKRGKFPAIYNRARQHFSGTYRKIIHVTPRFTGGDSSTVRRNKLAEASWKTLYKSGLFSMLHGVCGKRDSTIIGDKRATPFLKDVLRSGMVCASKNDLVLLTNNDTVLHADTTWSLLALMREEQAACAFRQSYTTCPDLLSARQMHDDGRHDPGRDLFVFTQAWLEKWLEVVPDYVLGSTDWDSTLATVIRMSKRIGVTQQNWLQRNERCELPTGFVWHESHDSVWGTRENRLNLQGNIYNRNLTKDFISKHGKGWFL